MYYEKKIKIIIHKYSLSSYALAYNFDFSYGLAEFLNIIKLFSTFRKEIGFVGSLEVIFDLK